MTKYQALIKGFLLLAIAFAAAEASASDLSREELEARWQALNGAKERLKAAFRDDSTPMPSVEEPKNPWQTKLVERQSNSAVLREQPRFNVEDYLIYLYRKIPISLLEVDPSGQHIHIRGDHLMIDLRELPLGMAEALTKQIKAVFEGDRRISGATFSVESYSVLTALDKVPVPVKTHVETARLVFSPLSPESLEKIRARVEDEGRSQMMSGSGSVQDTSCYPLLQIEK